MKLDKVGNGESSLETIISYLLITGVIISLCLEITGLVLFSRLYHNLYILPGDKSLFIQGLNFFIFLYTIARGEGMANQAVLFMTLGVAVLILTPYIRVIASFIYFSWKKDYKYALITLFVLIILTVSLTLH
jgi:uncharacterized membrane protein